MPVRAGSVLRAKAADLTILDVCLELSFHRTYGHKSRVLRIHGKFRLNGFPPTSPSIQRGRSLGGLMVVIKSAREASDMLQKMIAKIDVLMMSSLSE